MAKRKTQQQLYFIFWIVIVVLLFLIGWFVYLLIKPAGETETSTATQQTTTTNSAKKKEKAKANANKNVNEEKAKESEEAESGEPTDKDTEEETLEEQEDEVSDETEEPTDENEDETDEEGLVEPESEEAADDTEEKTVTLYFPKSDSACGEVFPVEREIEPTDDIYGQIILEDMYGPAEEEEGYTTAIPSGLHLRRVEYTAEGAVVTLNEAYNELDECAQKTVAAQLIETANAMFEFPEGTAGEVVVGTVEEETEEKSE